MSKPGFFFEGTILAKVVGLATSIIELLDFLESKSWDTS
jgi:hypothetical protein